MSDTTQAAVVATAPYLSTLSDASFSIALSDAALECPESVYGSNQERAQRYYVCHVLTLAQRAGAGELFHEKVGDVERRFHQFAMQAMSRWDSTSWGQLFKTISRKVIIPAINYNLNS